MNKRKIFVILSVILSLAIIFYVALYLSLNYYLIPKVILPGIREYVNVSTQGKIDLSIGQMSFHPIRRFSLKDAEMKGPAILNETKIIRAKSVDVDLWLLPLLWKKIIVKSVEINNADLNISRDATGVWNFKKLIEIIIREDKKPGGSNFIIRELKIHNGQVKYADRFDKDNSLEQLFSNVEMKFTNHLFGMYGLSITWNTDKKKASL